jgi:hypothetical protein
VRRAYAFADQGAASFLNAHFTDPANDPRLLGRELTRLVEVTGVLPVPGGMPTRQTWKVSWTERTIPHAPTALAAETAWEGYVTTRVAPPTTTAAITANPLGLYVTAVTWTQLGVAPGDGTRRPGAAASLSSPTDPAPPSAIPAGDTAGVTRPRGGEPTSPVPRTPAPAGGR